MFTALNVLSIEELRVIKTSVNSVGDQIKLNAYYLTVYYGMIKNAWVRIKLNRIIKATLNY